jgi:hypothetical protein
MKKILTSKFLLNLLVQISKVFINSKILFYFQKEFFSGFGPADHPACAAHVAQLLPPIHGELTNG